MTSNSVKLKERLAEIISSIALAIATGAFVWAWNTNGKLQAMDITDKAMEKDFISCKVDINKKLDVIESKLDQVSGKINQIEGYMRAKDGLAEK
jgi:hypothetical protein